MEMATSDVIYKSYVFVHHSFKNVPDKMRHLHGTIYIVMKLKATK